MDLQVLLTLRQRCLEARQLCQQQEEGGEKGDEEGVNAAINDVTSLSPFAAIHRLSTFLREPTFPFVDEKKKDHQKGVVSNVVSCWKEFDFYDAVKTIQEAFSLVPTTIQQHSGSLEEDGEGKETERSVVVSPLPHQLKDILDVALGALAAIKQYQEVLTSYCLVDLEGQLQLVKSLLLSATTTTTTTCNSGNSDGVSQQNLLLDSSDAASLGEALLLATRSYSESCKSQTVEKQEASHAALTAFETALHQAFSLEAPRNGHHGDENNSNTAAAAVKSVFTMCCSTLQDELEHYQRKRSTATNNNTDGPSIALVLPPFFSPLLKSCEEKLTMELAFCRELALEAERFLLEFFSLLEEKEKDRTTGTSTSSSFSSCVGLSPTAATVLLYILNQQQLPVPKGDVKEDPVSYLVKMFLVQKNLLGATSSDDDKDGNDGGSSSSSSRPLLLLHDGVRYLQQGQGEKDDGDIVFNKTTMGLGGKYYSTTPFEILLPIQEGGGGGGSMACSTPPSSQQLQTLHRIKRLESSLSSNGIFSPQLVWHEYQCCLVTATVPNSSSPSVPDSVLTHPQLVLRMRGGFALAPSTVSPSVLCSSTTSMAAPLDQWIKSQPSEHKRQSLILAMARQLMQTVEAVSSMDCLIVAPHAASTHHSHSCVVQPLILNAPCDVIVLEQEEEEEEEGMAARIRVMFLPRAPTMSNDEVTTTCRTPQLTGGEEHIGSKRKRSPDTDEKDGRVVDPSRVNNQLVTMLAKLIQLVAIHHHPVLHDEALLTEAILSPGSENTNGQQPQRKTLTVKAVVKYLEELKRAPTAATVITAAPSSTASGSPMPPPQLAPSHTPQHHRYEFPSAIPGLQPASSPSQQHPQGVIVKASFDHQQTNGATPPPQLPSRYHRDPSLVDGLAAQRSVTPPPNLIASSNNSNGGGHPLQAFQNHHQSPISPSALSSTPLGRTRRFGTPPPPGPGPGPVSSTEQQQQQQSASATGGSGVLSTRGINTLSPSFSGNNTSSNTPRGGMVQANTSDFLALVPNIPLGGCGGAPSTGGSCPLLYDRLASILLTTDHCKKLTSTSSHAPVKFRISKLYQIHNEVLLHGYLAKKDQMKLVLKQSQRLKKDDIPPFLLHQESNTPKNSKYHSVDYLTHVLQQEIPQLFSHGEGEEVEEEDGGGLPDRETMLDTTQLNECWLMHGTTSDRVPAIVRDGLDERVSKEGGLFGTGIYFTNTICKSFTYSKPEFQNPKGGESSSSNPSSSSLPAERCVMLCRVLLGDACVTDKSMKHTRRPPAKGTGIGGAGEGLENKSPHKATPTRGGAGGGGGGGGYYDSVIGNGKEHKEFVVYDRAMVLPQYIVHYQTAE